MKASLSLGAYSRQSGAALATLLANAWVEVRRLQACAERFATGGESTFCPRQVEALCGVLEQASSTIQGRIVFLDGSGAERLESSRAARIPLENAPKARSLMGVYRRCCRRLCRALHEAKRMGDATTTWLLNDLVLRLEKQLWLLDTAGGNGRAALLFFNC